MFALLFQRKSILWLSLAAIFLVLAGDSFNDFDQTFIKLAIMLLGFWPIYLFDDWLDQSISKKNIPEIGIFSAISVLAAIFFLDVISVLSLFAILTLGFSYNLEIPLFNFKPKKIIFLKNAYIALGWSLLVLFGYGKFFDVAVWAVTWAAFSQVYIGSVVRDFEDIAEDQINKVETLPIRYGLTQALFLLQAFNLASALILVFMGWQASVKIELIFALFLVYVLRAGHLLFVKRNQKDLTRYQTLNLLFCGLLFFATISTKG